MAQAGAVKLLIAALADYANVTTEGKLNVFGAFDVIHARQFPAVHLLAVVALRLMFEYEDGEKHHSLTVTIENEDGKEFAKLEGSMDLPRIGPGKTAVANQILVMHQVRFERQGRFSVVIRWDGKEQQRLPLDVVAISGAQQG